MNQAREETRIWITPGVLPVAVIDTVDQGLRIAEGLQEGGIHQIEVTLRTPVALQAMASIAKHCPTMRIAAGTIQKPAQFDQAKDHGASLFVSPGLTQALADHALSKGYPWVPGVATASEAMRAAEFGFEYLKFFPAMAAGGPNAVGSIANALADLRFIPTGGIRVSNIPAWREVPSVVALGGTWLTVGLDQAADVKATVAQRARQAVAAWNGTTLI